MRQTPVNDYLEEISTELPEELYGNLSDAIFETVCDFDEEVAQLKAENAKLREQMERLVTLLRADCDIEASWDGLRKFWSIGLTEDGCLMRDRACKAEAENAKLRELARQMYPKAKAFLQMGVRLGCNDTLSYDWYLQLRELGVEVD